MLSWFIQSVGFWGLLTLFAASGVFVWSWFAVFRATNENTRSPYIMLLLPLLIGVVAAAVAGYSSFASIRDQRVPFTAFEVADVVIHSMWVPLSDAVIVTVPSFVVITIGRVIRGRRLLNKPNKP